MIQYDTPLYHTALTAIMEAGQKVMQVYNSGKLGIRQKGDQTPVTLADTESSAIITKYLEYTGIPVICEENEIPTYDERNNFEKFWLVDPLDGTKEFISGNGEFTLNIGLVENGCPVWGCILVPCQNMLYWGGLQMGSYRAGIDLETATVATIITESTKLPCEAPLEGIKAVVSRSHPDKDSLAMLDRLKTAGYGVESVSFGSSLKFCRIAEGSANLYLRNSPTMEWDTAAGQAIAIGAQAIMESWPGRGVFLYNKLSLINGGFLVRGKSFPVGGERFLIDPGNVIQ
jgi:3'(2'), 5'-bisphosphate nucleotidase